MFFMDRPNALKLSKHQQSSRRRRTFRLGSAALVCLLLTPYQLVVAQTPKAASKTCDSSLPNAIVGTRGNDRLVGTDGPDLIIGFSGDDTIIAKSGDDIICAGSGADVVIGGGGDDLIYGGIGADSLDGSSGHDRIFGQGGDDRVVGGSGNDQLRGGAGNDELIGSSGNDQVIGGAGNDAINGTTGDDRLSGNGGDDRIRGADGKDTINGGAGADTLIGDAGNDIIQGGGGDDLIIGSTGDDQLRGNSGDDRAVGSTGVDVIIGGSGHDLLDGGGEDDLLIGQDGVDTLSGGGGNDKCIGEVLRGCETQQQEVLNLTVTSYSGGGGGGGLNSVSIPSNVAHAPMCNAPPLGLEVTATNGEDEPVRLVVEAEQGSSLRGLAVFSSDLPLATGFADDQVIRFDARLKNLDTGATSFTPLFLWQQAPDRAATTEDTVSLYSAMGNVGPGSIEITIEPGVEIYRGATGSVTATIVLTPTAPCCDVCAEAGGDIYFKNPVVIGGEVASGCFGFGPDIEEYLDRRNDQRRADVVNDALDAASFLVDVSGGAPPSPAHYVTGKVFSELLEKSTGDLYCAATLLDAN